MSSDTRQFIKAVEKLGFVYMGLNGRGHLRFHHPETGHTYRKGNDNAKGIPRRRGFRGKDRH